MWGAARRNALSRPSVIRPATSFQRTGRVALISIAIEPQPTRLLTPAPRRASDYPTPKGKQKATEPITPGFSEWPKPLGEYGSHLNLTRKEQRFLLRKRIDLVALNVRHTGFSGHRVGILEHRRGFHSTARRDAIPLIPAGAAILKSTSILTIITFISRVLISFFPLGTIAAFRNVRFVRWWSAEERKPSVSEEAEEFWLMWCQGEKRVRLSSDEAKALLEKGVKGDHGSVKIEGDSRAAWHHPWPPWRGPKSFNKYLDIDTLRTDEENKFRPRNKAHFIRETRFYLPSLPPSAVRYFDALSPEIQGQVTELRRYWISMRAFKDELWFQRMVVFALIILPCLLFAGVYAAALERVPFTGRWRIILLTAEEEEKISTSLAGPNWYKSIINLLTTPESPAPPVVPLYDWRWKWVEGILRRLELAAVDAAEAAERGEEDAGWDYSTGIPKPPPSKYPLRPVVRVSSRLHGVLPGGDPSIGREHLEFGPPFNLLLMDKDDRNAFSYGFGGKGAGGIVVFTGLLDDILSQDQAPPIPPPPPQKKGFFDGLFSPIPAVPPARPIQPTEEQSLHLACVVAHEMGHLLLGHHLETLSQSQVLWPSILGLTMDLVRAFIWPFTSAALSSWTQGTTYTDRADPGSIFLGPAVNDALANMGRTSTEELSEKYGAIGFQWKHEYEADLVGLRILARAGYSPQAALKHFSSSVPDLHEIQPLDADNSGSWTGGLFKLWTWATHPSREKRLEAIERELSTWTSADGEPGLSAEGGM